MSDKNKSDKGKATLAQDYAGRIVPLIRQAPWVLRVTEHRDRTGPVLVIKERISAEDRDDAAQLTAPRSVTRERGVLHGEPQRRCLPIIRKMIGRVQDQHGIPLELHRFLEGARLTFPRFVEQVVPILQSRGLFRTDYPGTTLRESLGLDQPKNQYTQQ